jgi:hypothetical protein
MAKIYASGNYVIVDDGTKIYEYAKGHTLYVLVDDIFYIKEITQGQYKVSVDDLDAGNITAEDSGDVYTVATFTTFLRENTGFKTASGGSGATPVGATLMKTGQTTSYRTGDDGDLEEGRATDFFTLASNNPFGSNARFTDELGGSTYTNNWVIDWSTYNGVNVLGYYRVVQGNPSNWNTANDNSLGTFGTFSGCRLPNINELFNIQLKGLEAIGRSINYAPFNISTPTYIWSSTVGGSSAQRLAITSAAVSVLGRTATDSVTYGYIPVRTFTVTGTTLT